MLLVPSVDAKGKDDEAHRLAFSILALAWAFQFLGPFELQLRSILHETLLGIANKLDLRANRFAASHSPPQLMSVARCDASEEPEILFHHKGMMVINKPQGWEVDVTSVSSDAICLSSFVQQTLPWTTFPVVHMSEFGKGFIHRLDVPSSGLVLVGTSFEGLYALQWQKNIYEISREYQVISHGVGSTMLYYVDARVNVTGAKASRTLTEESGQPAVSHFAVGAHLACRRIHEAEYCVIVVRIYTGRRHQIRAHTRHIGHPTATDGWYTPSSCILFAKDQTGPSPCRSWVRTPRWDGPLGPPPKQLRSEGVVAIDG
eukprot:gnl/TRDRNA2_/TRDRNA2_166878_c0_seq2.p1 gnl/TRDRNA2_/TRDRNA2_166878_c0~~gnl/TRDRNA2_/TRDRNA2_166878_c0_seq2.p1  ORF type:complete len:316 (-),score=27.08 gnl/TRDRNA2_/TRDRNA2_166878_c0_seq2:50-997(-)